MIGQIMDVAFAQPLYRRLMQTRPVVCLACADDVGRQPVAAPWDPGSCSHILVLLRFVWSYFFRMVLLSLVSSSFEADPAWSISPLEQVVQN